MDAHLFVVHGTVQGVGFRPFVYRAARACALFGTVRNTLKGVEVQVQGDLDDIRSFLRMLLFQAPPLARIEEIVMRECPVDTTLKSFEIIPSGLGDTPLVDISRDTAPCEACLREFADPANRRYHHPFINCTDCGPRYTIIGTLPYDRPNTVMNGFPMCERCEQEYRDPGDRRFHAQPVCCNECGPALSLLDANGSPVICDDPARRIVHELSNGAIAAIKGLGGFHLACRADSTDAVTELRHRKRREQRPLALMACDIETVRSHCFVSHAENEILISPERPIVLLTRRSESTAAVEVAPTVPTLGFMLPYTALHHLLFENAPYDSLVMTSANRSGEPMCIANEEALSSLRGIADFFLTHDRPIAVRLDDSVVRSFSSGPVILRKARGFVPTPIPVDCGVNGIIGLGGIMKSTVCVGRAQSCYVSQYLGIADNAGTIENCETALTHLTDLLGVTPELIVHDIHPAAFAAALPALDGVRQETVQHHHAHAVACMAENRIAGPAVCVVYDGLGLGDDGTIWGGELLVVERSGYRRAGHLTPVVMPGGDAATVHPGRMAMAYARAGGANSVDSHYGWLSAQEQTAVREILDAGINCPLTSSMGRLFDAVAAMLGVCAIQTYEGQAAIELEGIADQAVRDAYPVEAIRNDGVLGMDGPGLFMSALRDYKNGAARNVVAARFHNSLADMTVGAVTVIAGESGIDTVALTGGCFQNELLFERVYRKLTDGGLRVCVHRSLSPGDESVSFGQVVAAAWRRDAE